MIEIYKQKNEKEIKEKIRISISNYKRNPTILKDSLELKDEFIGNVQGDEFWIQKTKPRIFRGPSRAFYGKIITQNGKVKIVGKFKFLKIYRLVMNIWHVSVSMLLIWQLIHSILALNQFIIIFVVLNTFFEILFGLNILFYKKEEKEVIKFLYEL